MMLLNLGQGASQQRCAGPVDEDTEPQELSSKQVVPWNTLFTINHP